MLPGGFGSPNGRLARSGEGDLTSLQQRKSMQGHWGGTSSVPPRFIQQDLGDPRGQAWGLWYLVRAGRRRELPILLIKLWPRWDSPGSLVVKNPHFHFKGHGFSSWSGNEDPACWMVQPQKYIKTTLWTSKIAFLSIFLHPSIDSFLKQTNIFFCYASYRILCKKKKKQTKTKNTVASRSKDDFIHWLPLWLVFTARGLCLKWHLLGTPNFAFPKHMSHFKN